nr:tyrosine-protein kinase STYK1 isoform X2 [Geotrypetes seraphini]XP_033781515.1 tyrosine-protein kinase STYK1 isoform X2 [Geotrypetes seraphini]XP_033781516.1 tyrosine-protein kinase STYK1 isoform X2 [Geotrypetes seraphini]XP_033781517.1 tyrosine-protein kinase STYK1 isoform X2 [Geotrypetes seraphini]XP_033781518.1 tyrosine-protein kinase STYK1 isoform X2 [Geotrypetes seraphini]
MEDYFPPSNRKLLDCDTGDKLCMVQWYEKEVIIVPTLLIGFSLVVLGVILWLRYKGLKYQEHGTQAEGMERKGSSQETGFSDISLSETSVQNVLVARNLSLRELEIARARIALGTMEYLREGSFGPVYRAELWNTEVSRKGRKVVLKGLRDSAGLQEVKDFLKRLKFYQDLGHHRNLVQLIGCCSDQLPLYMIMENVDHGDLLTFLWTCRRDVMSIKGIPYDLTERQVYSLALQVLGALEFLQQRNLIHGDVAARSILVQSDFTAKLGALGRVYESYAHGAASSRRVVPLKWMAPERILRNPASTKSDIWSFGILLYEMITLGAPPYPEIPPLDILMHLQRGYILERPSSCQPGLYGIMKSCWAWKEKNRPSLSDLYKRLQTGMKSANDHMVLQIPELVIPELYANVAGIDPSTLLTDYTIL